MAHRRRRNVGIGLGVLASAMAVAVAAFLIWAETPLGPAPPALVAMRSDDLVKVTSGDDALLFRPATSEPTAALVFYPGGRVDYRSYAPFARGVASHGYLVVVPRMPLNLAVFAPNAAEAIVSAHPEIRRWAIGGHSLGGVMAAGYADTHRAQVRGLVLLASYPSAKTVLTDVGLACASVYGTRDPGAEDMRNGARRLPPGTLVVAIPGGNHAQFGSYGPQPGDATATIAAPVQQAAAVRATAQVLRKMTAGR